VTDQQATEVDVGLDDVPVPISRRRWFGYLAALVVAGLLVYAVVIASGGIRDAVHQLRHASRIWLAPALALEVTCYAFAGWLLLMLRGENRTIGWTTTSRVALVMWGLGSLLPAAPAEGIALSASELGRRGVSRQDAVAMLLVAGWCQFWALVLTAVGASVAVDTIGHPDPDDATRLLVGAAILSAILLIALTVARRPIVGKLAAAAIRWMPRHRKKTRDELRAIGLDEQARLLGFLGRPVRRVGIWGASAAWWMADAGALWMALHAAHADVDFSVVILAYVAGTVASWVPLLPGGLGAVEIAVPAVLHHFGVPLSIGLAATLLWRGMSLFVPAMSGALAYGSLRSQRVGAR
jgi:uncharacterized protein (TIRG00374 family)